MESIGLTRQSAIERLQVSVSTAARWWNGQTPIPVIVRDAVLSWVKASDDLEREIAEQLRSTGTARTYLTQDDLATSTLPKSIIDFGPVFHRVSAARALMTVNEEADGQPCQLCWADDPDS